MFMKIHILDSHLGFLTENLDLPEEGSCETIYCKIYNICMSVDDFYIFHEN